MGGRLTGLRCRMMPPTHEVYSRTWPGLNTVVTESWWTRWWCCPIETARSLPPASRLSCGWRFRMMHRMRGGLCIFGATTGEMPLDPTIEIHTRDVLPADLAVDSNRSPAIPAGP